MKSSRRELRATLPRPAVRLMTPSRSGSRARVCSTPKPRSKRNSSLARAANAELRFGEKVTKWRATESGVEVTTVSGTYGAARLVHLRRRVGE